MSIFNLQIAETAEVITKSDATVLEPCCLFVGTGGDITVDTIQSKNVVFKNIPDGSILYVFITKVYSTGTTASDMLALK